MKTTFTVIFILAFICCSAQQKEPTAVKELSAGDYLIKAGKQKNIAIALIFGGSFLSGIAYASSNEPAGPVALGVISYSSAIVFEVLSNYNLKNAGRKLNESKIGMASSGIGIRYTF